MRSPLSTQAKQKISAGMKRAHQRRREVQDPTKVRIAELAANFALGHPDGKAPARVRNFGGIGRDVTKVLPQSRAERTQKLTADAAARREDVNQTAREFGLIRADEKKAKAMGESGGKISPPVAPAPSKRDLKRRQLMDQRPERISVA